MGKDKLRRWNELATFERVIQTETNAVAQSDHPVKGKWNETVFNNNKPLVLELGCGKGEYTTGLARVFPGKNFTGVDIKGARMWRGAKTANEEKLLNVAFLRTRIEFIRSFFARGEVDEIWITFPDPHPGRKNSPRRLSSPAFLNKYREFLRNDGLVHLKTDNTELYEYSLAIASFNKLDILFSTDNLYNCPQESISTGEVLSIKTHYEKLFVAKGMNIKYLCFRLPEDKIILDDLTKKER